MYRTAAKRLLSSARQYNGNTGLRFRRPHALITSSRFSTTESQPFSNPQSINDPIPISITENPSFYDSTSSSSSSDEDSRRYETPKSRVKYEDENARLLSASLTHVVRILTPHSLSLLIFKLIFVFMYLEIIPLFLHLQMKLGWTEAALVAGAKDVGLSPSIVGSLSRKEAALVEVHFLLYISFHA
jgi:ubiquinone biosynthesis protein COQ9